MKSKTECPRLAELAEGCNAGMSNSYALIRCLGEAVQELGPGHIRDHPAIKCIVGHLSYLIGESLGPTFEALEAYKKWREEA